MVTGGTATLTVRGADSTVVYQSDLTGNGTFQSTLSTAGTWFIDLLRRHEAAIRPPFNRAARAEAGFTASEQAGLEALVPARDR